MSVVVCLEDWELFSVRLNESGKWVISHKDPSDVAPLREDEKKDLLRGRARTEGAKEARYARLESDGNGSITADYFDINTSCGKGACVGCMMKNKMARAIDEFRNRGEVAVGSTTRESSPVSEIVREEKKAEASMTTTATTATAASRVKDTRTQEEKDIDLQTKFASVAIERKGVALILPEEMSNAEAIRILELKEKELSTKVNIYETFDVYPLEGAYAFYRALSKTYGWVDRSPKGFFGSGEIMVKMKIDRKTEVEVPWGQVSIPGIEGVLQTGAAVKDGRVIFVISGNTIGRDKPAITKLMRLVQEEISNFSVYKGKAISVSFPESEEEYDVLQQPDFIDLSQVKPEELIFSNDVNRQINNEMFNLVRFTDNCRAVGIPLKRGILLEGPFGTGKSLAAAVLARLCEENGWTFIQLKSITQLVRAVDFARLYQPAVIFSEDIDHLLKENAEDEDDESKALVYAVQNTLDGVATKSMEVMTVFTTNDIRLVQQRAAALLRPGRLDSIVSVLPPDQDATERLLRLYGRGLIKKEENIGKAAGLLAGRNAATVREAIERAKLGGIGHLVNGTMELNADDLEVAARAVLAEKALVEKLDISEKPNEIAVAVHDMANAVRETNGAPSHKLNGATGTAATAAATAPQKQ